MKVKDLQPSERNPRKISQAQLNRLSKSMDEYGDLSGLVFNRRTGRIVGGHMRRKHFEEDWPITIAQQAKKGQALDTHGTVALGYVDNPETKARWTYREVDWPEKREVAANIAANVHGGEFDEILKRDALEFIDDGTLDYDLVGGQEFVEEAMTWTPEKQINPKADEVPEAPKNPIAKMGDVWELGIHRLLCGDSGDPSSTGVVVEPGSVDAVFTSPPYNVGKKYSKHDNNKTSKKYFEDVKAVVRGCFDAMKSGRMIAWNVGVSPKSRSHDHAFMLEKIGFRFYRHIVWKKTGFQIPLWQNSKKRPAARYYLPNYNHEVVLMMTKGDVEIGDPTNMPDSLSLDVWDICQFQAGGNKHPAAFPVALVRNALEVMTAKGETAYEPYSGSGSTFIACEESDRKCIGIEIDPAYCDVAVERWQNFTGKKAKRVKA